MATLQPSLRVHSVFPDLQEEFDLDTLDFFGNTSDSSEPQ